MKQFLLNVGEVLIDEKYQNAVLSTNWKLSGRGYIQSTSDKYKGQYLHRVIAELAGLECIRFN